MKLPDGFKSYAAAFLGGLGGLLLAFGVIDTETFAIWESICASLFAWGIRHAVAKGK